MKIALLLTFAVAVAGQTTQFPGQQAVLNALRAVFNILDLDNNGVLTLSEQEEYFDKIDTNDDGKLSWDEYEASRNAIAADFPRQPEALDRANFQFYDTLGNTQDSDGFLDRSDNQYFFALIDSNGDGQATLKEFDDSSIQIGQIIADLQDPSVGK